MIEIKKVSKKFDKLLALDSVELNIQKGTVLGLVGSNGSGNPRCSEYCRVCMNPTEARCW